MDNPFLSLPPRLALHPAALTPTLTLSALFGTDLASGAVAVKRATNVANALRHHLDQDIQSGLASAFVVAVASDAQLGHGELAALSEVLRVLRGDSSSATPLPRLTVAAMTSDADAQLSMAQPSQRTASLARSLGCAQQEVLSVRYNNGNALLQLLGLSVRRTMDEALSAAEFDDGEDEEDKGPDSIDAH